MANYANTVVALVAALLVTPILVRGLGKDAYGTWILVTSTVLYLDLLRFGFGRAVVKYVAEGQALGDPDRVRRTVATSFFALSIPGLLVITMSPGLAFLFPELFNLPEELRVAAMVLVVLSAVDLAFGIPGDAFGGTLIGYQRYDLLNATLMATAIAQASAWIVILVLGGGLVPIGVATLVFSLAGQGARYLFAQRLIGANPLRRRYFDRELIRPLLSMSGWIAVTELATVFIVRLDVVIVGLIAGVASAGVYAVGQKLALLAGRFTSPASVVFFPHASELAASGDRQGLRETIFTGTRIAFAIATPLTLVLALLAGPAVHAWVGPGFEDATLVVVFLSGAILIGGISQMGTYVLRGMGDVKLPAIFNLIEAALNFSLSVALGLTIGIKGVALATLIASFVAQFGLVLPYACRRTETSITSLLLLVLRAHLLPAGLAVAVGLSLRMAGVSGIAEVIGAGAAMMLIYYAALLVTGLSTVERRRLFDLASRRLGGQPA